MASLFTGVFCVLSAVTLIHGENVRDLQIVRTPRNVFTWNNCNTSALFNITSLSVSPDPIHLMSLLTISFSVEVKEDIGTTATLQVDINATLTVLGQKINVCDYVSESTCHPRNLCSILQQIKNCPDMIDKLVPKCQCPLKKNIYTVTKATLQLPSVGILVSGPLDVHLTLTENNQQLACLNLHICIESCD